MNAALFGTLAAGAVTVGSLHTLAPDHWVPFAALARARGWSAGRTARVTAACGFGHVTVSALLGLAGFWFGLEMVQRLGSRMESAAGILLVGFGLAYGIWGLRRAAGRRFHGHSHSHYDHVHDSPSMTAGTLFLLFAADPCVAVIPILFAAAPLGAVRTTAVVVALRARHHRHDGRPGAAGPRRGPEPPGALGRPIRRRGGRGSHRLGRAGRGRARLVAPPRRLRADSLASLRRLRSSP